MDEPNTPEPTTPDWHTVTHTVVEHGVAERAGYQVRTAARVETTIT